MRPYLFHQDKLKVEDFFEPLLPFSDYLNIVWNEFPPGPGENSLTDKVMSLVIREEVGVELLLLLIRRKVRHLFWMLLGILPRKILCITMGEDPLQNCRKFLLRKTSGPKETATQATPLWIHGKQWRDIHFRSILINK